MKLCQNWVVFKYIFGDPSFNVGSVIRISFTRCDRKNNKRFSCAAFTQGMKIISNPGDNPEIVLSKDHASE